MRLTLRTVLAYLDDVLEPEQAREIGAKVHESGFASALVTRIKDVLRRRRIEAPPATGPNATPDANVIAEYLDNALPPDQVAELERVCLDSDLHLAEVAAVHQILTIVLGEPVEIPPSLRERVYALGGDAAGETRGSVGSVVPESTPPKPAARTVQEVPEPLKRRGWPRKMVAAVVVAAIVLAWVGLLITEPAILERDDAAAVAVADNENEAGPGGQQQGAAAPAGGQRGQARALQEPIKPLLADGGTGEGAVPKPAALSERAEPFPATAREVPKEARDDPTMSDRPLTAATGTTPPGAKDEESETAVASRISPTEGPDTALPEGFPQPLTTPAEDTANGESEGAGATADEAAAEPAGAGQQPEPAAGPPPARVAYVSNEGVLLHRENPQERWYVLAKRALVFPSEDIASPIPYTAALEVERDGLKIVLQEQTRLAFLDSSTLVAAGPDLDLGMAVQRGRVAIDRTSDAKAAGEGATEAESAADRTEDGAAKAESAEASSSRKLVIQAGGHTSVLSIAPQTRFGIEVVPRHATGSLDEELIGAADVHVLVPQGTVEWTFDDGQSWTVGGKQGYLVIVGDSGRVEELMRTPEWLRTNPIPQTLTVRKYATQYENEFDLDQPVDANVAALVRGQSPFIATWATQTMALTGNHSVLVQALDSPEEGVRLAAIEGLRTWLTAAPGRRGLLRTALSVNYRADEADAIEELLLGYSREDLRGETTSAQLLEWMNHDRIAIRELAFYYVHKLTNRDYGYVPSATSRERSLERWRQDFRRYGNLLNEE